MQYHVDKSFEKYRPTVDPGSFPAVCYPHFSRNVVCANHRHKAVVAIIGNITTTKTRATQSSKAAWVTEIIAM